MDIAPDRSQRRSHLGLLALALAWAIWARPSVTVTVTGASPGIPFAILSDAEFPVQGAHFETPMDFKIRTSDLQAVILALDPADSLRVTFEGNAWFISIDGWLDGNMARFRATPNSFTGSGPLPREFINARRLEDDYWTGSAQPTIQSGEAEGCDSPTGMDALFMGDIASFRDACGLGPMSPGGNPSYVAQEDGPEFVVGLSPGEGIKHFFPTGVPLSLRDRPSSDGVVVALIQKPAINRKILYDQTQFQTITAGRWAALVDVRFEGRDLGELRILSRAGYYSDRFPVAEQIIPAGDTIEYLQPRAEGNGFVRIDGTTWEAPLLWAEHVSMFTRIEDPSLEWWIRVTEHGKPRGWLLVSDSTVTSRSRF